MCSRKGGHVDGAKKTPTVFQADMSRANDVREGGRAREARRDHEARVGGVRLLTRHARFPGCGRAARQGVPSRRPEEGCRRTTSKMQGEGSWKSYDHLRRSLDRRRPRPSVSRASYIWYHVPQPSHPPRSRLPTSSAALRHPERTSRSLQRQRTYPQALDRRWPSSRSQGSWERSSLQPRRVRRDFGVMDSPGTNRQEQVMRGPRPDLPRPDASHASGCSVFVLVGLRRSTKTVGSKVRPKCGHISLHRPARLGPNRHSSRQHHERHQNGKPLHSCGTQGF